jgi:ABC-type sugar transport system permease subunit
VSVSWREDLAGWGFLSFAFAIVGVFVVSAIGYIGYLSLTDYSGIGTPGWVGLKNYADLFADPVARTALVNTLIVTGVSVPAILVLSLAVALLLNREFRGVRFVRAAYFLPSVISVVVAAAVFRTLYEYPNGVVNTLLDVVGIAPIAWYTDSRYALGAVIVLNVWRSVAFFGLIFLAALQDTPQALLDAAKVDGANAPQRLRHVIVPHLRPVILFATVLSTVWGFRTFAEPNVLTNGGPGDATRTVALYAYNSAFQFQRFGFASAMAILLLIVIVLVSVVQLKLRDDDA